MGIAESFVLNNLLAFLTKQSQLDRPWVTLQRIFEDTRSKIFYTLPECLAKSPAIARSTELLGKILVCDYSANLSFNNFDFPTVSGITLVGDGRFAHS